MSRDPETIQREIEQTRDALASTLDELAERTSPKRLAGQVRHRMVEAVTSPAGLRVLGVTAVIATVLVIRRARRRRAS